MKPKTNPALTAIRNQEIKWILGTIFYAIVAGLFAYLHFGDYCLDRLGLFSPPSADSIKWGLLIGIGTTVYNGYVMKVLDKFNLNPVSRPFWNWTTALAVALIAPLSEEIIFRGVFQTSFGLVIAALMFAVAHIETYKPANVILSKFPSGLAWGYCLMLTGNIWSPVIAHATNNIFHVFVHYIATRDLKKAVELNCTGNHKEALALFDLFCEKNQSVYALRNRAACCLALKLYDRAIQDSSTGIARKDDYSVHIRAQAFCALGQYDAAKTELEAALKRSPKSRLLKQVSGVVFFESGEPELALAQFTEACKRKKSPLDLVNLSAAKLLLFRYDEAIEDATNAINRKWKGLEAYQNRGIAYLRKNDFEKAEIDLKQAVELAGEKDWPLVFNAMSLYFAQIREPARGIELCTRALTVDKDSVPVLTTRALCYTLEKRFDEALSDLEHASTLPVNKVRRAYLNSNRALIHLIAKRVEPALQAAELALLDAPDQPTIMAIHARALIALGQNESAVQELSKAIEKDPYCADALWFRSIAYEALGNADAAETDKRRCKQFKYVPFI